MNTRRLFITGTDTGVGKTYVACRLARELRRSGLAVGAYKPVCSGAVPQASPPKWDDVERLFEALDRRFPREQICPQTFLAPVAPPAAARLEDRLIDEALLVQGADRWNGDVDVVLIEGAGGWLSPVSQNFTVADLAVRLSAPVLVVAANRLGVINHTLLTVESIRSRGLPVAGVILNETAEPAQAPDFASDNLCEIESRGKVPVLGILPFADSRGLVRFGRNVTLDLNSILASG